jgi:hypothetical protein
MLTFWLTPADPPDVELQQRAANSDPTWQSYHEDIKGQIGARMVAQWRGEPIDARRDGARLSLRFRLRGPWAEREALIPILVRESSGETHAAKSGTFEGHSVIYTVDLAHADHQLWIEVQYPLGERRLSLAKEGVWQPF